MKVSEQLKNQRIQLEKAIDYRFKNSTLLYHALTHRSVEGLPNNERLEFLGDAVLSLVMAEHLVSLFPQADEGQLSRLRAQLVRKSALAEVGQSLKLGRSIQLGLGESKSGGQQRQSIIADALESLIGALFEDSDYLTAKKHILVWFQFKLKDISLENAQKDSKTQLQEWCQRGFGDLPVYKVLSQEIMDKEPMFTVEASIEAQNLQAQASAKSRKKAEQAAAKALLIQISSQTKEHD